MTSIAFITVPFAEKVWFIAVEFLESKTNLQHWR